MSEKKEPKEKPKKEVSEVTEEHHSILMLSGNFELVSGNKGA